MNSLFKYPSLTVTSPCASESGVIAFMWYKTNFGEKPTTFEIQLNTASMGPLPEPLPLSVPP